MAREARRRCRCGEGCGKDVGLDRRGKDVDGREARKRCRGEKGTEVSFFLYSRDCGGLAAAAVFSGCLGWPAVIEIIRW